MQLTQWVFKIEEKRFSGDNTEFNFKKNSTYDSTIIVNYLQLSNSNSITKESSKVQSYNNEPTAIVSKTIDMNTDISGLYSTHSGFA